LPRPQPDHLLAEVKLVFVGYISRIIVSMTPFLCRFSTILALALLLCIQMIYIRGDSATDCCTVNPAAPDCCALAVNACQYSGGPGYYGEFSYNYTATPCPDCPGGPPTCLMQYSCLLSRRLTCGMPAYTGYCLLRHCDPASDSSSSSGGDDGDGDAGNHGA